MISRSIRPAEMADAAAMSEIYRPYIEKTAITFMTGTSTAADFEKKIGEHYPQFPFLVCVDDGRITGYAYASPMRPHNAYQWDCELTIYVDQAAHHQGVGKALYQALLTVLKRQGYRNAYSVITVPNAASLALHQSFGFEQVGCFKNTGYKLGAWRDVVWLCKTLNDFTPEPEPPTPFRTMIKEGEEL